MSLPFSKNDSGNFYENNFGEPYTGFYDIEILESPISLDSYEILCDGSGCSYDILVSGDVVKSVELSAGLTHVTGPIGVSAGVNDLLQMSLVSGASCDEFSIKIYFT